MLDEGKNKGGKDMKKFLACVLALCMLTGCLAGCAAEKPGPATAGTPDPSTPAPDASAPAVSLPDNYDLIMTFGAETGSVYAMGIQIGEYINSLNPNITCTVKVGSSGSNITLLCNNQTVIAHSGSDIIHEALMGTGDFTQPMTGFYGVASVMQSVLHVVVPADCPVSTFRELVEQKYPIKLSVGTQGSGIETLMRKLLAYYGVTYDDIASWGGKVEYLNIGDASTLFTDGQLNGVSVIAGMPYSSCAEIAASKNIKFLSLDEEAVESFSKEGYIAQTIPAGTYNGQTEDTLSIANLVTVCASGEADEEVVYQICKFLNSQDGIDILSNVNSGFAEYMTGPESGIAGIEVELHPGAARFYQEAGVLG